ncbi:translation initiation factor IF-1 [Candidatus Gracilibacteria bacterium]|nr:translation initiation factor IF-1 [Candidatus Gracilibacteria bacterium]
MTSDDLIEVEGIVKQTYPGSQFLIELTTEGFEGHQVKAKLSGKMRMHYIRIVTGDHVQLELSPYNLEEGRITFRFKKGK